VVLLILWLLGFSFHVDGGLIHLLLLAAVVVVIFNVVSGSRAASQSDMPSAVPRNENHKIAVSQTRMDKGSKHTSLQIPGSLQNT
jgi:hypothetical protein